MPGERADLLRVVEAVLPALEAGLTPGAALGLAAEVAAPRGERSATSVLVGRLAGLSAEGQPIGPFWAQAAAAAQSPELRLLAQAWSLTEDLGAPLAEAVRTTAGLLRARIETDRRTAGAVAGARATMNVLTALPLGGPLVALALGMGPRELYAGSAVTGLCLVAGGVLVLGGRWWVARMVRDVARGPVLR
jgi:tight adherence protein B